MTAHGDKSGDSPAPSAESESESGATLYLESGRAPGRQTASSGTCTQLVITDQTQTQGNHRRRQDASHE